MQEHDNPILHDYGVRVMVFNATFNNISVISWRLILLVNTIILSQVTDSSWLRSRRRMKNNIRWNYKPLYFVQILTDI